MSQTRQQSAFPFDALNDEDIAIIGACLNAILTGPVFKIDHAFRTLLAPSTVDIAGIATRWPDCNDPMLFVLVNNVLTNLVWYPHGLEGEKWSQYIPAPPKRLEEILGKMKKPQPSRESTP